MALFRFGPGRLGLRDKVLELQQRDRIGEGAVVVLSAKFAKLAKLRFCGIRVTTPWRSLGPVIPPLG